MKTLKTCIACSLLIVFFLTAGPGETVAAEGVEAEGGKTRSMVIYSVSVEPAKVASGDTILIEAVFSVFDESSRSSLPMQYFCEIETLNELIFSSPVRSMNVQNGAKSHLDVKLQATGDQGDYKVILKLLHPDGNVREEGSFSIVSPMEARMYRAELLEKNPSARSAVENRLVGKWQFVASAPELASAELVISNKDGKLAARVSREDAETLWIKLRKTDSSLVVRSKSKTPGGDCWFVMENVITFNDQMDDMPVRSKILEGGRCVPVGQVSESIIRRVE